MDLTLIVPGLAASVAQARGAGGALARFARYAAPATIERDGLVHATGVALGLADPGASAPLRALGAGMDPADDYVLGADPVALVAGRGDVRLDGAIDDLDAADAASLIAALGAHFAGDGLAFAAPRPDAWFARLRRTPSLETTPLDAIVGRPILGALPRGGEGGTWQRWQNETQMLLFTHPVNAAREARGLRPVTGVWFWGGGRADAQRPIGRATLALGSTGAAGDLLRGAARLAGRTEAAAPATFDDVRERLDDPGLSCAVIGIRALAGDDLPAFAAVWADPATRALERGMLRSLNLVGDGNGVVVRWTATRPSAIARLTALARRATLSLPAEASGSEA
jgi:hypothetical protein